MLKIVIWSNSFALTCFRQYGMTMGRTWWSPWTIKGMVKGLEVLIHFFRNIEHHRSNSFRWITTDLIFEIHFLFPIRIFRRQSLCLYLEVKKIVCIPMVNKYQYPIMNTDLFENIQNKIFLSNIVAYWNDLSNQITDMWKKKCSSKFNNKVYQI